MFGYLWERGKLNSRLMLGPFIDKKLARFIVVGLAGALLYFCLSYAFQVELGWTPFVSSILAYGCAFGFAYLSQLMWTFGSPVPHRKALPRYAVLQVLCALITASATQAAAYLGGFSPFVTSIIATAFAGSASYVVSLNWVFNDV